MISYDLLPIDKVPYNQNPSGPKGKVSLDYLATQATTSLALYNIRSTIERFVNVFQEADGVLGAFMPKAEYLKTVDYTIHYSGAPFGILIPYPNSDIHYVTSVADPLATEVNSFFQKSKNEIFSTSNMKIEIECLIRFG